MKKTFFYCCLYSSPATCSGRIGFRSLSEAQTNMRLWSCQTTENTYVLNIMCQEPPWTTTTDHVERTGGT